MKILLITFISTFLLTPNTFCVITPKALSKTTNSHIIKILLTGDVMLGRGIDQIHLDKVLPQLHESYVKNAKRYVDLAVKKNGFIPTNVSYQYIWGDALRSIKKQRPDATMINLETSITTSNHYWQGKGIHYRMHPNNIAVLKAAQIDIVSLANNHILDWGYQGLTQTITTLQQANIKYVGAGSDLKQASSFVTIDLGTRGRIIFLAFGVASSGIYHSWQATPTKPGVNYLKDLSTVSFNHMKQQLQKIKKRPKDIIVVSIHWGGNWGYKIPQNQIKIAHHLIDQLKVDIIHAHSSHHPKGIEVYKNKLILYGVGDLINDYEGIRGREYFRNDLSLLYFVSFDTKKKALSQLIMQPMRIKNFRLQQTSLKETKFLKQRLQHASKPFNTKIRQQKDAILIWFKN